MKIDLSANSILLVLLTLICVALLIAGLNLALQKIQYPARQRKKIVIIATMAAILWMLMLAGLSLSGFFGDFTKIPPRPGLAMLVPLPLVLVLAFSKTGNRLLQAVPQHWLVFMQSFRIVVEVLLWLAFVADKLPVQMTFEGRNFDVLSGILALPVGYILLMHKNYSTTIGVIYNIVGLILLLNILVIAVLSMPGITRYFMTEPANILVAQVPYIWLPGILVPIAYSLHIFSLRQLLLRKREQQGSAQLAV